MKYMIIIINKYNGQQVMSLNTMFLLYSSTFQRQILHFYELKSVYIDKYQIPD